MCLSILVYYSFNYKSIYKPQVPNNQEIKLFKENFNLIRNLTFSLNKNSNKIIYYKSFSSRILPLTRIPP